MKMGVGLNWLRIMCFAISCVQLSVSDIKMLVRYWLRIMCFAISCVQPSGSDIKMLVTYDVRYSTSVFCFS
jgi:hypothetical protein